MSDLKPGRELDALVAEKIFGAKLVYSAFANDIISCDFPDRKLGHYFPRLPAYSTSIEAAWEAVLHLKEKLEKFDFKLFTHMKDENGREWCATFYEFFLPGESGETACHAICLAALRAMEYDPNK